MTKNGKLSAETEQEIVSLYRDSDTPVVEIEETYDILSSKLYRLLKKAGVPTRAAKFEKQIAEADRVTRILEAPPTVEVTVDAVDTVQKVEPKRVAGGRYRWEITFFGLVEVMGDTPEDALKAARALAIVRDIRHVKRLPDKRD